MLLEARTETSSKPLPDIPELMSVQMVAPFVEELTLPTPPDEPILDDQELSLPSVPDATMAETPTSPQSPQAISLPEPIAPSLVDLRELDPSFAELPEPELPELPIVTNEQQFVEDAELPDTGYSPELPEVPPIPKAEDAVTTTEMPDAPELPELPEPQVPADEPLAEVHEPPPESQLPPELPEVPQLPKVEEAITTTAIGTPVFTETPPVELPIPPVIERTVEEAVSTTEFGTQMEIPVALSLPKPPEPVALSDTPQIPPPVDTPDLETPKPPEKPKWDADWIESSFLEPDPLELPRPIPTGKPGHGGFKFGDPLGDVSHTQEMDSQSKSIEDVITAMQSMQNDIHRYTESKQDVEYELFDRLVRDNANDLMRLHELNSAFQRSRTTITDVNI